MAWGLAALLALPALWLFILLLFAGPARAAWREPVLRHPVLIIESDDWGPGPSTHAEALERLAACLGRHRDGTGRPAVMTLGLTLSLPDSEAIAAGNLASYHARPITDPAYADILAAIQAGIRTGVFAPQLHGMAHYWPDTLLAAARRDPEVKAWVLAGPGQETEALPSALQSRWVDGGVLPSGTLREADITAAVAEETGLYRTVFGIPPAVAVPPTFIWTTPVEAAWAARGVNTIVTPGHRCTGRDAAGKPHCEAAPLHNGQAGAGGVIYLVRDRYFEPARGHRAAGGLDALAEKTRQGRPCLLETHRFNFTGPHRVEALAELDTLLALALEHFPEVRFTSTAELAGHYRGRVGSAPGPGKASEPPPGGGEPFLGRPGEGPEGWIITGLGQRLEAWAARMAWVPRFARLSRLSGLQLVLALLQRPAGRARS